MSCSNSPPSFSVRFVNETDLSVLASHSNSEPSISHFSVIVGLDEINDLACRLVYTRSSMFRNVRYMSFLVTWRDRSSQDADKDDVKG